MIKIQILVKNWTLKIWSILENRNFDEKMKFWLAIEIFWSKFGQKSVQKIGQNFESRSPES